MKKIYYDEVKNHTVIDEIGIKTISQINEEYTGSFIDITEESVRKEEASKLAAQEAVTLNQQIQDQRNAYIDALIAGDTETQTAIQSSFSALKLKGVKQ